MPSATPQAQAMEAMTINNLSNNQAAVLKEAISNIHS